jgi:NAD(P)H-hydrate epimerase
VDAYLAPLLALPILLSLLLFERRIVLRIRRLTLLEVGLISVVLSIIFEEGFPRLQPAFVRGPFDYLAYVAGAGYFWAFLNPDFNKPHIMADPLTGLSLEKFREMDYLAVEAYDLSIELMMENAGLQLARLVARAKAPGTTILIGVGNGNNGGGGLVAARRLAAWGYHVHLDLPAPITQDLPTTQLERALAFGALQTLPKSPDVWVDAYLGFSQKLPLRDNFLQAVRRANASPAFRISLDIPTGISGPTPGDIFQANQVLTLAAYKKVLLDLPANTEVFLADLGIPKAIYERFGVAMPNFRSDQIIQVRW